MSYKGYSFNLHKEDDRELIEWLSNKKVTRTIKIALYNQMKSESANETSNTSLELLSVIKRVIESNADGSNKQSTTIEKKDRDIITTKKDDNKQSLSEEDADDFEKIFDI